MTVWIGLTGGIGAGKSQATQFFADLGVNTIDADAINRQLINTPYSPVLQQIAQTFGADFLDENRCLNRHKMRQLVFQNPNKRTQLENILHPHIIQKIKEQQSLVSAVYGIIEIAILAEKPIFRPLVQRILLIDCPESIRIERVMKRNKLSHQQVKEIISAQASDRERQHIADDIINNQQDLTHLQQAIVQQHQIYTERYRHAEI